MTHIIPTLIIIAVCLFLAHHYFLKPFSRNGPFRVICQHRVFGQTMTFIEFRPGRLYNAGELEKEIARNNHRMATAEEVDQLLRIGTFVPKGVYIIAHQGTGQYYRSTLVHGERQKKYSDQVTSALPIGSCVRYAVVPCA